MKLIKYKIICNTINKGTIENPIYEDIFLEKKITYSEENLSIAKKEAYKGEYSVIETDEGIEIKPLGVEFGGTGANNKEDALKNLGAPNVFSDTYKGAGGYGADNSNSITFPFIPKIVFIQDTVDATNFAIFHYGLQVGTIFYFSNCSYSVNAYLTWNGTKLSWHINDTYGKDELQLNLSGRTYSYVAIG